MTPVLSEEVSPGRALKWMLEQGMITRRTTKDPETFIPVQGYILSDELRDAIGTNLVKLFGKATRKNVSGRVTVGDAFITATMAAVLETAKVSLSQEELTDCTSIVLTFLPFEELKTAGIARKPLRSLASDKALVRKFRNLCAPIVRNDET